MKDYPLSRAIPALRWLLGVPEDSKGASIQENNKDGTTQVQDRSSAVGDAETTTTRDTEPQAQGGSSSQASPISQQPQKPESWSPEYAARFFRILFWDWEPELAGYDKFLFDGASHVPSLT
ncbi:hypothetical protein HK102_002731 [Quaeritorhiza haematococci]|nr:hypothetical protein HK102_002731 [Quaeritorhiza haematococci]